MIAWNVEETRKLVRILYGPTQLEIVRNSISSVVYRQRYAKFHLQEVKTILGGYIGIQLESKHINNMLFLSNIEEQNDYEYCQTKIGSHITAFIQAAHSLTEILANMVYFSLGYYLPAPSMIENKITLHNMQHFLSENTKYLKLSEIFKSIWDNKDWKYLTALLNHSEHWNLIKATLWFDATGKPQNPYTLKFEEFRYYGESYADLIVLSFLEDIYNYLSRTVIEIGSAVNTILLKKAQANNISFTYEKRRSKITELEYFRVP